MSHALLLEEVKAESAQHVFPIVPDPANDLAIPTRAIRCDTGGTLVVNTVGGQTNVTVRFANGETRYLRVSRVISATASNIEGMA